MDDPDAPVLLYGIGAQKAGTTWLYEQLARQEGVFLARPKEIHYWDRVRAPFNDAFLYRIDQRLHAPGPGAPLRQRLSPLWNSKARALRDQADRLRDVFRHNPYDHSRYLAYLGLDRPGVRLVGDITPAYALLDRHAFGEMYASAPNARFVFIMRDPVSRLWSGLRYRYRKKLPNVMSEADLARALLEACSNPLHPDLRQSDYVWTITELEAAVPSDRIHYAFFETLLDPAGEDTERKDIIGFLGLEGLELHATEQIHVSRVSATLPESHRRAAEQALEHCYGFILQRFGDRVPTAWQRPD